MLRDMHENSFTSIEGLKVIFVMEKDWMKIYKFAALCLKVKTRILIIIV